MEKPKLNTTIVIEKDFHLKITHTKKESTGLYTVQVLINSFYGNINYFNLMKVAKYFGTDNIDISTEAYGGCGGGHGDNEYCYCDPAYTDVYLIIKDVVVED